MDCALNDIRSILGNDIAIKSYREGKLPFPEGTIIARIAWNYIPSEENNKIFGRPQSFADRGRALFVSRHRTPLVRPTRYRSIPSSNSFASKLVVLRTCSPAE
jgi:hypothetical protein